MLTYSVTKECERCEYPARTRARTHTHIHTYIRKDGEATIFCAKLLMEDRGEGEK